MSFYEIRFGVPYDDHDYRECLRIAILERDTDESKWTCEEEEYAFNGRVVDPNEYLMPKKHNPEAFRMRMKLEKQREHQTKREGALIFLLHGGSVSDCHKMFGIPTQVIESWLS
ncbi:MAG: hypothetical protein J6S63_02900 [Atopobiaceae bacterium]|nr:hypothetical protein [Atopobiaceae bacterium]